MFIKIFSPKNTINFLSYKKYVFVISALLIIASVYTWISKKDDKYGIDYKGGSEIVVGFEKEAPVQDVRKALSAIGIEGAVVQSFGDEDKNEIAIKVPNDVKGNEEKTDIKSFVEKALNEHISSNKFEILKVDFVGPTAGEELRKQSLIAIALSVVGILIYISVRFEFAFALGAVVALFHDIIIGLGLYLLFGRTISVVTLAAALTILGYSVNDTIVVFDRIREKLMGAKNYVLEELVNKSITETFSRTIITSLTTLFTALSLLILGGGEIRDLSLFLVIGIIAGTMSTIFIASPVAIWWSDYQAKREKAKKNKK